MGGLSDNAGVWWDHDGGRMGWRLGVGIGIRRYHNPGPWVDRDGREGIRPGSLRLCHGRRAASPAIPTTAPFDAIAAAARASCCEWRRGDRWRG